MPKKIIIISTSLRLHSNSDAMAQAFGKGAMEAGHDVEVISLRGKKLAFCMGCLACQKTGRCVICDDANAITDKVLQADVVVFATPIYYYEMSGQMKTLLDRMNSMYPKAYRFREVYFLATAAEDDAAVPERAIAGLTGWIDCFEKAALTGTLFCGGVNEADEIQGNDKLTQAYALGMSIH